MRNNNLGGRIIDKRGGIGCIRVNLSNKVLFTLFVVLALLFIILFITVDLIAVYVPTLSESETQSYYGYQYTIYQCEEEYEHRTWLYADAIILCLLLVIVLILAFLRCERSEKKVILLSAFGVLMQVFFLLQIPWLVVRANFFWKDPSRQYCGNLGDWMNARLIIGFILIVIGLVIYSIRPKFIEEEDSLRQENLQVNNQNLHSPAVYPPLPHPIYRPGSSQYLQPFPRPFQP